MIALAVFVVCFWVEFGCWFSVLFVFGVFVWVYFVVCGLFRFNIVLLLWWLCWVVYLYCLVVLLCCMVLCYCLGVCWFELWVLLVSFLLLVVFYEFMLLIWLIVICCIIGTDASCFDLFIVCVTWTCFIGLIDGIELCLVYGVASCW